MDFNLPEQLQRRICFALIPAKSLCWPPKLSHYRYAVYTRGNNGYALTRINGCRFHPIAKFQPLGRLAGIVSMVCAMASSLRIDLNAGRSNHESTFQSVGHL
jgi:hypothetical protein